MKYANAIASAVLGAAITLSLTTSSAAFMQEKTTHPVVAKEVATTVVPFKKKKKFQCKNTLARRLYHAGFRGRNLREAWSIAMRESGGNPRSVSSTHDYGVFQFNRAAWHREPWWDQDKLLTPGYNIRVAYRMSRGGKTWYPWDISGRGTHLGRYTSNGTFSEFKKWYRLYPC